MCVCPPHVPLLRFLWNSDWNSPPPPPPFRAFPPAKLHPIRRLDAVNIPSFFFFFFLRFIWICVLISSVVLPIECMLLTAVFSSCLKTGLFLFWRFFSCGFPPPAPSSLWPMCSVSRRYSLSSILYLVKLVFSESTVGGARGLMFCFVLFFFFFFMCLACFFFVAQLNTPPPLRCLCTLCCSTAVSWWNLRYLIWSTCCPVLPDSMRKIFFCHSFLFCTLLFAVTLIFSLSICIVLSSVFFF